MPFVNTATRLWRRLTPAERGSAAEHFVKDPAPEMAASAVLAVAQARHMRPQTVRALRPEERARALAQILDPGEALAGALVVALHLGLRRPLLAAFLDLLKIPHEDGVLKEEAGAASPPTLEAARAAVLDLAARFPAHELETYLNALWLQDPDHWAALADSATWLSGAPRPNPAP